MNPGELSQLQAAISDALARYGEAVLTYILQRPSDVGDATRLAEPELQSIAVDPNVIEPIAGGVKDGGGQAEATTGIVWGGRHQAAMDYAKQRAAEMVGMRRLPSGRLIPNPDARWSVPQATRDHIQNLLVGILDRGGSQDELGEALKPAFSGLFGEYRAEMIARTELAMAQNMGVIEGYRQGGVEYVRVLDNPECKICGPFADTIQTVQWAGENPVGHPHCIRAFNSATIERDAGGGAMGAGAAGGISTATGLTGYNLEGQHDDCKQEDCDHESHKRSARA